MKSTRFFKTGSIKNPDNLDEILGYTWENKNGYTAVTSYNNASIYEPDGHFVSGVTNWGSQGNVLTWLDSQEKYCL